MRFYEAILWQCDNGKIVNIPSLQVKAGDVIGVLKLRLSDVLHYGLAFEKPASVYAAYAAALRAFSHQEISSMVYAPTRQGTIKKYFEDKGFGFIQPQDGGKDLFFHCNAWKGSSVIREGQHVSFTVTNGPKGPAAENVEIID